MRNEKIAILAGGCFWCTEPVFSQFKGVSKVESGYIGGHTEAPTYKTISQGDTGHAEGIRITYDEDVISYETLLEVFFTSHDPTTLNRQGQMSVHNIVQLFFVRMMHSLSQQKKR